MKTVNYLRETSLSYWRYVVLKLETEKAEREYLALKSMLKGADINSFNLIAKSIED